VDNILITGGTVIDGTGRAGVRADVAIRRGRIVGVGQAQRRADETIDAHGLVVAPGFVDIHTHYDAQVLWDPMLTISPWHGVTTVVIGNCGFGIAPTRAEHRGLVLRTLEKVEGMSLGALVAGLGDDWPFETFPQYLDVIERRGTAINVGALVGHTPLRLYVMGEAATERRATDTEIAQMRALLRDAMEAGALGFATSKAPTHVGSGGKPVPSRVAGLDEIEALAGVLGDAGRGIVQATVGRELFFEEFTRIVRATGRPLTWTALLTGMLGPGSHRALLTRSLALISEGLPIVPQVTCRPLNFEFQFKEPFIFESMALFRPVSAADLDGKARIYADPKFRCAFKEAAARPGADGALPVAGRWDRTWISWCPSDPVLEERTVAEVAAERGAHPVDVALDLALASRLEARSGWRCSTTMRTRSSSCSASRRRYSGCRMRVPTRASSATPVFPRTSWGGGSGRKGRSPWKPLSGCSRPVQLRCSAFPTVDVWRWAWPLTSSCSIRASSGPGPYAASTTCRRAPIGSWPTRAAWRPSSSTGRSSGGGTPMW
jgi:N-acyl-D-aspartate/D-glutamate deacylase